VSRKDEKLCRERVYERADGLCELCGKQGHTFHHRKKRGQGGPWSESNVVLLCGHGTAGDHGWVEANPVQAERMGFHVRPWNNPAEHPILLHRSKWVWLQDSTSQYSESYDKPQ
jgi:5-methylcytosine-specific restriction endonuclease McrA